MIRALTFIACGAILALLLSGCGGGSTGDREVLILAAASTQDALADVAALLREREGIELIVSPGGSNAMAQQILAGAPADLFLAASEPWAQQVAEAGHAAESVDLLGNALVIVTPADNPANVQEPRDLLSDRVARVALAGEHVPAGSYAEQALRAHDLHEPLVQSGRLVRGHNVRFTLAYVERGEVDAAVVYATDAAAADDVAVVLTFDSADHDPIVYPLQLLERGAQRPAARRAWALLQSPEAAAIFKQHGFRPLPTEPAETR